MPFYENQKNRDAPLAVPTRLRWWHLAYWQLRRQRSQPTNYVDVYTTPNGLTIRIPVEMRTTWDEMPESVKQEFFRSMDAHHSAADHLDIHSLGYEGD